MEAYDASTKGPKVRVLGWPVPHSSSARGSTPDSVRVAACSVCLALCVGACIGARGVLVLSCPQILNDNKVPVALKSDHPVLFSRDLMFEAAKAHYYGLPK